MFNRKKAEKRELVSEVGVSDLPERSLHACRSLSSILKGLDWTEAKLFSPDSPKLVDLSLGQAAYRYIENSRAALDAIECPNQFSKRKPLEKLVELSHRLDSINACLVEVLPYQPIPKIHSLPLIHGKETLHVRPHFGIYRIVKNHYKELEVTEQRSIFEAARATYLGRMQALEFGIANPQHFWSEKPMKNLASIADKLSRDRDIYSGIFTLMPFAERNCSRGSRTRENMLAFARKVERQLSELVDARDADVGRLTLRFDVPSRDEFVVRINVLSPKGLTANIEIHLGNPKPAYALMEKWNMDPSMRGLADWVNPPAEGRLYSLKKKSISVVQSLFAHLAKASHLSSQNPERMSFTFTPD